MRDLFGYITKHSAQTIILDYKLKPFIPDYIPAVGDIDAFLKVKDDFLYSVKIKNVNRNICCVQVNRPDMAPDKLGLTVNLEI